jgi:hypothetical protein
MFVVAIALDVEAGAEDADIDGGGMDEEGVVFVAGDVEIGFAGEGDFAVRVLVVDLIRQAAVGVEPDEGAVGKLEFRARAGAGADGIIALRGVLGSMLVDGDQEDGADESGGDGYGLADLADGPEFCAGGGVFVLEGSAEPPKRRLPCSKP